jgi:CRISPR/Cas system-associated endoribonuclease Cas2
MTAILVTYDLNNSGKNYEDIEKILKSYTKWAKLATTTFIIITDETCVQVRDKVKGKIDSDDELLVVGLNGNWATSNINKKISDWLKENL